MGLSNDLVSQFAKLTNNKTRSTESTIYGTVSIIEGRPWIKFDGSDRLTPADTTVSVVDGERVTALVKDHTVTITGNVSSPAARNDDVDNLAKEVAAFDTVIADKVKAETAEIETAIITKLDGKYATFEGLDATYATIKSLEAAEADIGTLQADNVIINKKITARDAEIDQLQANSLTVEVADAKYATIENLEGLNADFNSLESTYADFVEVTTNSFEALEAEIAELDVESLNAKYANIDFTNIGKAAMENFYANSGLIQNVVVGDQTITGELVGVTIRGDRIIGGSIVADKLVIKGNDGIYYKLNAEGGATPDQLATEEFKNGLHGSNIIANSITAEKIDVKDLVAFDATIGNFNIGDNSIYSGAKASVDNITRGIYMDTDGQLNFGDSNNYLKFYKDQNGAYKLAISADSLTFSSGKNVEDAINNIQDSVDNIQIGGRNLFGFNKGLSINNWSTSYGAIYLDKSINGIQLKTVQATDKVYALGRVQNLGFNGVAGESYTFSATVYANVDNISLTLDICDTGNCTFVIGTTAQKISFTATPTAYFTGGYNGFFDVASTNISIPANTIVYFKNIKIERGNKATDWTPAPEDVTADIDDIRLGGDNPIKYDTSLWKSGVWNTSSGYIESNLRIRFLEPIPVDPGVSYRIDNYNNNYRIIGLFRKSDGSYITSSHPISAWITSYPFEFTPPTDAATLVISVCRHDNSAISVSEATNNIKFKISVIDSHKTATNYMNYDATNGLVIGDMTASTLGNNVRIDSDSVDIRNGDTIYASYGANTIYLGKNSNTATIDICDGLAQFTNLATGAEYNRLNIHSRESLYLSSLGDIAMTASTADANDTNRYHASCYVTADEPWNAAFDHTNTMFSLGVSHESRASATSTSWYTTAAGIYGYSKGQVSINAYNENTNKDISVELWTTSNPIDTTIKPGMIVFKGDGLFKGALHVTGATTLAGALTAKSTAAITGTLTVSNTITGKNLVSNDALSVATTASIFGDTTIGGNLYMPNNRPIYMKNASGVSRQMMYIQGDNLYRFGYGGFANAEGRTDLLGNEIRFYVAYANNTNYKPYYDGGDSVSLEWYGAGFISSSGGKVYFSIPLMKPVIGGCSVSVTSVGGITIRQNGQYVYGSTSSTGVALATSKYSAVVDNQGTFIRITATMPNTTNAINNEACGIHADIKLTFAYG